MCRANMVISRIDGQLVAEDVLTTNVVVARLHGAAKQQVSTSTDYLGEFVLHLDEREECWFAVLR